MITGKSWGCSSSIFKNSNCEFHRISIQKNGYCSKHKHEYKYNLFYVEKGILLVYIWKNDYKLCDCTIIKTGEKTIVKPNEYHMFEASEDTIAYEIYYTESISDDIIRETCGGIK